MGLFRQPAIQRHAASSRKPSSSFLPSQLGLCLSSCCCSNKLPQFSSSTIRVHSLSVLEVRRLMRGVRAAFLPEAPCLFQLLVAAVSLGCGPVSLGSLLPSSHFLPLTLTLMLPSCKDHRDDTGPTQLIQHNLPIPRPALNPFCKGLLLVR